MPSPPPSPWFFDSDWGTFWQIFGAVGSLALAAIAIVVAGIVAWRQFRVMHEQGLVINNQVTLLAEHKELLSRIERIEDEQRTTLKRQGEIAERQYQIMEEQLARKAVLSVRLSFLKFYDLIGPPRDRRVIVQIGIHNSGTRSPEDGLFWRVLIPSALVRVSKIDWDEPETAKSEAADRFGEPCQCYENHLKEPAFPKRTTFIGTIDISVSAFVTPFMVSWGIVAADGAFPSEDADGELPLTKNSLDEMYLRSLPIPGQPKS